MKEKLKSFFEQYELREKYFTQALKIKSLESQVYLARAHREKLRADSEAKRVSLFIEQVDSFSQKETNLQKQLNTYVEKFKHVEAALDNSNELFVSFRKEMEQMTKKRKTLEKENMILTKKTEVMNKNIIDFVEEITRNQDSVKVYQKKIDTLESVCRALQADRNVLVSKLEVYGEKPKGPVKDPESASSVSNGNGNGNDIPNDNTADDVSSKAIKSDISGTEDHDTEYQTDSESDEDESDEDGQDEDELDPESILDSDLDYEESSKRRMEESDVYYDSDDYEYEDEDDEDADEDQSTTSHDFRPFDFPSNNNLKGFIAHYLVNEVVANVNPEFSGNTSNLTRSQEVELLEKILGPEPGRKQKFDELVSEVAYTCESYMLSKNMSGYGTDYLEYMKFFAKRVFLETVMNTDEAKSLIPFPSSSGTGSSIGVINGRQVFGPERPPSLQMKK